jgi:WG containing repeat
MRRAGILQEKSQRAAARVPSPHSAESIFARAASDVESLIRPFAGRPEMMKYIQTLSLTAASAVLLLAPPPSLAQAHKANSAEASTPATLCQYGMNSWAFSEGLEVFPFAPTGKSGFIARSGQIAIQPKFIAGDPFHDGMAPVFDPSIQETGAINRTGKLVVPYKFDMVVFSEGLGLVHNDHGYGFIDKTGAFVIPAQFDGAAPFREGLAAVALKHKWGFINKSGKLVIPMEYDAIAADAFFENLAGVFKGDRAGFIDRSGAVVIPLQYKSVQPFSEDLAAVTNDESKVGYIDRKGALKIPYQFLLGSGFPFCHGLARGFVSAGAAPTLAVIDATGKEQFRVHNGLYDFAPDGLALLNGATTIDDGWFLLVDSHGRTVLKVQGNSAAYSEGILSVLYRRNNVTGLENYKSDGRLLTPEILSAVQ